MNELNNLSSFAQVVRSGSFVAAAAQLNVSQSTVSTSVSRLEKRLGVCLLKRTTRRVQLTVEGQTLYNHIGDHLTELERALDRTRNPGIEPNGLVRLSTVTTYGREAVLPILPEFLARYPSIDVRISFHENGRGLSRHADDLRITWEEELEAGKVARALRAMELILVASPAYLARAGTPLKPEDLEQHEFVLIQLPNGIQKPWTFYRRPVPGKRKVAAKPFCLSPRGRLTIVNETGVSCDAAHAGLGLAVTVEYNAQELLHDGSLVRLLPDYEIRYQNLAMPPLMIQYPLRKDMPQRVRVLLDYLLEKLAPRPV